MACHTPPLEKAMKQEEAQLPALNPIPFRIQGLRMGNDISLAFSRGGLRLHFRLNVDGPNVSAIKAICSVRYKPMVAVLTDELDFLTCFLKICEICTFAAIQ